MATTYEYRVRGINGAELGAGAVSASVPVEILAFPGSPENLVAMAGDESVTLRWEAPTSDGGSAITGYTYRYRTGASEPWMPSADGVTLHETTSYVRDTIDDLINGTTYTFEVRAHTTRGVGPASMVEVMLNSAPMISGFGTPSFDENGTGTVTSYTATDVEGDAIEWSLSGRDAGAFMFTPDHIDPNTIVLSFPSAPDYEHPVDLPPTDNVYEVTVVAEDDGTPRLSTEYQAEVRVVNVDEDGIVELSPLVPQVGVPLTAELTDPDGGITGAEWQWQGQEPGETTWQTLSGTSAAGPYSSSGSSQPYPELSSYTPQAAQVGWTLRAVVNHYRDVFGAGKRAHSDPTVAVRARVPTAPENLTAVEGDGSVTLTWEVPLSDGGASITGYTYRYRAAGSTTWQPSDRGTTLTATTFYVRETISNLTNDTAYTFEVWANNAQGPGAVAQATATPRGPFTLTVTVRDEYVFLHWTAAPSRGEPIDHYAYRYSRDGGTTWTGLSTVWFRQWDAGDPLFYVVQRLTNEVLYTFEVYAYDSAGEVAVASASAMPGEETADVQVVYGSDSYQVPEGAGAVKVRVLLTAPAYQAVSIPVTVTKPAATESGDYTVSGLTAGALSFAEDAKSRSFTIRANEDTDSADETVTLGLTLTGLPSWLGAGTPTTATVTLQDNDGHRTVSFGSASYEATEGESAVEVSVLLSKAPSQRVSIPVSVSADTGTEPGDYTVSWLTAGALSFARGVSSRSFTIRANEDTDSADETVSLTFGTLPSGVVAVGTTRQATVWLLDNDRNRTVSFGSVSYQATEGGSVEVSVLLSKAASQTVSIPVTVTKDRDTEPGDYMVSGLTAGALSFAAGDRSQSFEITANEDADGDDEWVSLTFGTLPSGVVAVGTTRQATVWLRDNDGVFPLTASRGDGQVALRWTAPTSGTTISEYQVQWRISDSGQDWSSWATVPGGSTARDTTVTGLTNGQTYQFAVQAVDSQDASVAVSNIASATPAAVPGAPPHFRPSPGDGQVVLRWDAAANNGSEILRYEVQWRVAHSGHGWPGWSTVSGGSTARDTTVTGLTNGETYQFAVRAVNGVGDGAQASQSARPLVETQYAYRAWQTAPLFDAPASGTPDNWSSSKITWTDAAPRVWRIGRTRPSGGNWSEWGTLEKHSERPVAYETFYQRASSTPSTPGTQTGTNLSTPSAWQTTQPTATATESVWTTTANRAAGEIQWIFTAPTQETPPTTVPAPGPVRELSAEGGSVSGSIAVSWDAPNTGGTPDLYRVESRQGSAAWQAGGTTTQTSLSIGDLVGGSNYSIQVRAENSGGNSRWRSTTATATNGPQTQYAYRASQTAPLFDAPASGTPDNWSSGELTWTDTAPRVWRISRTRPSGGNWSAWGTLEKYSERPAASATFYQRDSSAPSTPGTQTGTNISTPSTWQTTQPTATATESVWSTTANRAKGETPWVFTVPTQETPPTSGTAPGLPRNFDADTGSPLTAGSIDLDWDAPTSGGTPTGYRVEYRFSSGSWLLGATPTLTNVSLILPRAGALYQFQVRAENSADNSGWVETTGTTSGQAQPPERQTAYKRNDSGTTAPAFSSTSSGVPYGWSSSQPSPTSSNRYVWSITRTRPAGGSWSSWGSAEVVSKYTERQTAYKRNDSGTTAPAFSSTASGVPYGWSSSQPSPTSSNRYVWSITRTRPAGGSWSSWVVQRSCLNTPSVRRRINATTRARPLQRSAARPVECLMAGHRHSRVLRRAIATCGVSLARVRRVARGRAGVVQRWWPNTPSVRRRINATTRVRRPRRSVPRPAECLMAGHRHSRVLRRAIATCGVSLARVQRVARGPVGVVQRSCLNTPSVRRRINATTRARPPRRSAARPAECLMAGHRRSRVLPPATATCGVLAVHARRVARGPVGVVQRSCLNTPSVRRRINATTRARPPGVQQHVEWSALWLVVVATESYIEQPLRVEYHSHAPGGWLVVELG